MNKTPPRIGIIGCGAAARRYYLPAFKRHQTLIPHLHLVDIDAKQAKLLAQDLGGGHLYSDYHEILGKVDGVIILLPHFLHAKVAGEFLASGAHVLCEKPLTETGDEARALTDLAQQGGLALCVNNTRRLFPSFQAVKQIIDSGELGTIRSITYQEGATFAWPSATGFYVNPAITSKGVLLDVGAHILDLICWWLGEKPKVEQFQDDSFGGPESVARLLLFSDTCHCEVFLNRLSDIDSYFHIEGSRGSIRGDLFDWNKITVETVKDGMHERKLPKGAKDYPGFILPIVDNFVNVLRGKESPLISGKDVLPSIELLEECYQNRSILQLPWYDLKESSNKKTGRVLVTGATGFIGARIVEYLYLTKEYQVRAGIRQWSSAARLGRFPVDIVLMDLMDPQQIDKGLDGITHVIHCAKGPAGVTEEGTRNLLEAALSKGIKRFVHLSTAEVYGNAEGEISEEANFQYTGNEYNRSKIEAEKVCWEYHKKGLPLVVLRPSIVYGPFSGNWTVRFASMLQDGIWGEYEKIGEGICNLIYVDDVVHAALLALNHETVVGEAFNLNGPDMVTWNDYFRRFNSALGLPPLAKITASRAGIKTTLMLPVRTAGKIVKNHFMGPVKKLSEKSTLAKKILKSVERKLTTTPVGDELKLFSRKAIYRGDKAAQYFSTIPVTPLEKGIMLSCNWLKHLRLLAPRNR